MAQSDDGRGNLYEQVLEYAKREMDEAASKMEEIKQSLQLLEARVEAAKAVYQAVASRLNLEDEAEGPGFESSFVDVPPQAPEPPPPEQTPIVEASLETQIPEEANGVSEPPVAPEPSATTESLSDMDLIRAHLAGKATENETQEAPPANPVQPGASIPAPAEPEPPAADEDSFSMQLIRKHLEQKAQEQEQPSEPASAPAPAVPESVSAPEPPEPAPSSDGADGGGLSEADRELIGAYLRSKQN